LYLFVVSSYSAFLLSGCLIKFSSVQFKDRLKIKRRLETYYNHSLFFINPAFIPLR